MYHIIVNPISRSGRGLENWNIVEKYLNSHNVPYHVYISQRMGHITEIAREITRTLDNDSEPVHIIIIGGDGSINETLQGICNFDKVRLSYIPTGSGNDFARDLNMPSDPLENLERILNSPREKQMDIGKATYDIGNHKSESRYFAVSCGLGFDAAVCEAVLHSPAKAVLNKLGLGKLIYLVQALRLLIATEPVHGTLTLEDRNETKEFSNILFAAAMNHRYEGGGFMFAPGADDSDGYLNLCLIDNIPKMKVIRVLPTAFKGNHIRYKEVHSYCTRCYTLHTDVPMWLQADGEIPARTSTVTISCIPKLLHFCY